MRTLIRKKVFWRGIIALFAVFLLEISLGTTVEAKKMREQPDQPDFEADTSTGTALFCNLVEYENELYAGFWNQVYRVIPQTGELESYLLYDKNDARYISMAFSDHYVYVMVYTYDGECKVMQYTLDGIYIADVAEQLLEFDTYIDRGYIYFISTTASLCRKKLRPGSEVEVLDDECRYAHFILSGGKLHGIAQEEGMEEQSVISINIDGTGKHVLGTMSDVFRMKDIYYYGGLETYTPGSNYWPWYIYEGKYYFQNYREEDKKYYCLDPDNLDMEEIPLVDYSQYWIKSGYRIGNEFVYSVIPNGFLCAEIWIYNLDTGEKRCIADFSSDEEFGVLLNVGGQTRIYYETGDDSRREHSMNLDGSDDMDLCSDVIRSGGFK